MRTTLLCLCCGLLVSSAHAELVNCTYISEDGIITSVSSRDLVPEELRDGAQCSERKESEKKPRNIRSMQPIPPVSKTPRKRLPHKIQRGFSVDDYAAVQERAQGGVVKPNEVDVGGSVRKETLSTELGRIEVQWPRSVERLFEKEPKRAVVDVWRAAARALARDSFPRTLRNANYRWNVVIMDEVPASVDLLTLPGSCHPGWMRPPADIFIAASRVVTRCSKTPLSKAEASKELAGVLLHELGHAVEFHFIGKAFHRRERWHAEGFASWFETLGNRYLVGADKRASRSAMRKRAKKAYVDYWRPQDFRGTNEDYARAYAMIAAIAERRSVGDLTRLYQTMDKEGMTLRQAADRVLGWNEKKWREEVERLLK